VIDEQGSAQARAFLSELYGHVSDISNKLEAADERNRRSHARGTNRRDPIAGTLRRELHETHRLIDGLHRRFPDTAPHSRVPTTR
jgi:hypothetical protein